MILGVQGAPISQVQLERAKDSGTMGGFRAVIAAGDSPNQWFVVHQSTLEQYQQLVVALEANLKTHQEYIAKLMTEQGFGSVIDGTDEPTPGLDAASAAVVNSLLCSVPENKFYRDND